MPADDLEPWMLSFLESLANRPNVSYACHVAGVSRPTAYKHRQSNELFREKWDEAWEVHVDRVEERVLTAATDPERMSEAMARLFLSRNREKYADKPAVVQAAPQIVIINADEPAADPLDAAEAPPCGE